MHSFQLKFDSRNKAAKQNYRPQLAGPVSSIVIQHCDEYNTYTTILLNIHSFYLFLQSEEHDSLTCLALLGQGQSIYNYYCMLLVHHKLSTEIYWMFTYRNSISLENSNCKFFCYYCYGWKKKINTEAIPQDPTSTFD